MTIFSKYAGAIAVAAALGATAFSAAPAQAQGFGFQINPPNSNFSFGFNIGEPNRPGRRCISTRSLDEAIEDQGFRRVRITDVGRRTTEARGVRGSWLYEIVADTCSGQVIDRDRIRRV
jgi:hypothetical protein